MKYILIFVFLFNTVSWSQVYLNIKKKDGTTQSFNIDDVRKLTFSGVVNVEEGKLMADAIQSFSLLQNYPNPFNPTTTIEYIIPEAGNVDVSIFSISGEMIKTLSSGYQNAGTYKVKWNSKNEVGQTVSSGIYIYHVRFNSSVITKKLMLIK